MNFLLINGSPNKKGSTRRALDEIACELRSLGAECEFYDIGKREYHSCVACGFCSGGNGCIFEDLGALAAAAESADGIVVGTPTHFATPPGTLLSVLSRLFYSERKKIRYKPALIIGSGRRGCVDDAICCVERFFKFAACPIISGSYPAIIYGKDYESAGRDTEGLCNMRHGAQNIYYIASAISLARGSGILPPDCSAREKLDIPYLTSDGK